jgi:hypothetical protein
MGLGPAAESGAAKSISPLLLPTASTLTVVLAPTDSGLPVPNPQTVPIGSTSATVTFEGLEFGEYEVAAAATDEIGTALFAGGATVTFSESKTKATLDLIPLVYDMAMFSMDPYSQMRSITVAGGAADTYLLLPSIISEGGINPIPAGAFELSFDMVYSPLKVFVQNADGTLLFSGDVAIGGAISKTGGTSGGSGPIIAIFPASNSEPVFLTLYNSGTSGTNFYCYLNYDNMS